MKPKHGAASERARRKVVASLDQIHVLTIRFCVPKTMQVGTCNGAITLWLPGMESAQRLTAADADDLATKLRLVAEHQRKLDRMKR